VIELVLTFWLFFGATLLIAFSSRLSGRRKLRWVLLSQAPLASLTVGAIASTLIFPQYPFHVHSVHIPTVALFSITGTWVAYVCYRRNVVQDDSKAE
jgi:hypothetical protein